MKHGDGYVAGLYRLVELFALLNCGDEVGEVSVGHVVSSGKVGGLSRLPCLLLAGLRALKIEDLVTGFIKDDAAGGADDDDAAIAADNPGVTLPSTDITVAHRSDGSGTTANFTGWLVAAATPAAWTLKSGSTVEWPADTQGGTGNAGVAQIVGQTDGAIGYVDLSDAKAAGLKYADVKNQAGTFIEPTADSASVAGDGVEGGGGSEVAAPIVRDVLIEVQKRDPARRVPLPDSIAQAAPPAAPPLPVSGARTPPG